MFYYLFTYFNQIPGARLVTYISFRAIVAAGLAFLISMWFGKHFIAFMRRKNISEEQRDVKVDPFGVQKKGVPTMGGLIIIAGILVPCLLLGKLTNVYMMLMLITTLLLGLLGFADDYIKTFRHNKAGLNGWVKIAGQITLGLIVGLTLRYFPAATMNETVRTTYVNSERIIEKSPEVKSTRTTIPFVKNHASSFLLQSVGHFLQGS